MSKTYQHVPEQQASNYVTYKTGTEDAGVEIHAGQVSAMSEQEFIDTIGKGLFTGLREEARLMHMKAAYRMATDAAPKPVKAEKPAKAE